ncbi:WG repeat-containing protein [Mucilaginibacter sp.]|uniref:WG repeat-containing protein n=1 Tax=Mucilaginibacter sp. TaxID=1882438 RepID=UPI00326482E4
MKAALIIVILFLSACQPNHSNNDYLFRANDSVTDSYGYLNAKGDTIIPFGKYLMCFTDTFKTFALVTEPKLGFVGIDRHEKILFKVFPFDNGPDYVSEGYFRIIDNNKIGYADTTGRVAIQPQYACAFPFENDTAKVSNNCKVIADGEHSSWQSDSWYYIDKTGKRVK